jgi:predicted ATPase
MLGGGPGVGKTRLAMEMADCASRVGFRCLVGHCYERDEAFPYLPFAEIIESDLAQAASLDDFRRRMGENAAELVQIAPRLRRVFPDIPQPPELPPTQKRRYLIQSVAEALGRATKTRSYLYILEDLHWAHESTLALLNYLANRVAQLPLAIVGTYRDGFSDDNPARSLPASRPRAGNTCMPASPTRLNGWILAPSSARGRSQTICSHSASTCEPG